MDSKDNLIGLGVMGAAAAGLAGTGKISKKSSKSVKGPASGGEEVVRLYRIENPNIPAKPLDPGVRMGGLTSHPELVGQWFTQDVSQIVHSYLDKSARTYGKPSAPGGPVEGARLVVAEVPANKLAEYHVFKHPIASQMDIEGDNYIIPRDGSLKITEIPLDETISDLRGPTGGINFNNQKVALQRIQAIIDSGNLPGGAAIPLDQPTSSSSAAVSDGESDISRANTDTVDDSPHRAPTAAVKDRLSAAIEKLGIKVDAVQFSSLAQTAQNAVDIQAQRDALGEGWKSTVYTDKRNGLSAIISSDRGKVSFNFTPEVVAENGEIYQTGKPAKDQRSKVLLKGIKGLQNYVILTEGGFLKAPQQITGLTNQTMAAAVRKLGFTIGEPGGGRVTGEVPVNIEYEKLKTGIVSPRIATISERLSGRIAESAAGNTTIMSGDAIPGGPASAKSRQTLGPQVAFGPSEPGASSKAPKLTPVVYHGTRQNFTEFDSEAAGKIQRARGDSLYTLGNMNKSDAIYFTDDPKFADFYTGQPYPNSRGEYVRPQSGQIRLAKLELNNPYETSKHSDLARFGTREGIEELKALGHDGFIYQDIEGGPKQYAVFSKEQIHSPWAPSSTDISTAPDKLNYPLIDDASGPRTASRIAGSTIVNQPTFDGGGGGIGGPVATDLETEKTKKIMSGIEESKRTLTRFQVQSFESLGGNPVTQKITQFISTQQQRLKAIENDFLSGRITAADADKLVQSHQNLLNQARVNVGHLVSDIQAADSLLEQRAKLGEVSNREVIELEKTKLAASVGRVVDQYDREIAMAADEVRARGGGGGMVRPGGPGTIVGRPVPEVGYGGGPSFGRKSKNPIDVAMRDAKKRVTEVAAAEKRLPVVEKELRSMANAFSKSGARSADAHLYASKFESLMRERSKLIAQGARTPQSRAASRAKFDEKLRETQAKLQSAAAEAKTPKVTFTVGGGSTGSSGSSSTSSTTLSPKKTASATATLEKPAVTGAGSNGSAPVSERTLPEVTLEKVDKPRTVVSVDGETPRVSTNPNTTSSHYDIKDANGKRIGYLVVSEETKAVGNNPRHRYISDIKVFEQSKGYGPAVYNEILKSLPEDVALRTEGVLSEDARKMWQKMVDDGIARPSQLGGAPTAFETVRAGPQSLPSGGATARGAIVADVASVKTATSEPLALSAEERILENKHKELANLERQRERYERLKASGVSGHTGQYRIPNQERIANLKAEIADLEADRGLNSIEEAADSKASRNNGRIVISEEGLAPERPTVAQAESPVRNPELERAGIGGRRPGDAMVLSPEEADDVRRQARDLGRGRAGRAVSTVKSTATNLGSSAVEKGRGVASKVGSTTRRVTASAKPVITKVTGASSVFRKPVVPKPAASGGSASPPVSPDPGDMTPAQRSLAQTRLRTLKAERLKLQNLNNGSRNTRSLSTINSQIGALEESLAPRSATATPTPSTKSTKTPKIPRIGGTAALLGIPVAVEGGIGIHGIGTRLVDKDVPGAVRIMAKNPVTGMPVNPVAFGKNAKDMVKDFGKGDIWGGVKNLGRLGGVTQGVHLGNTLTMGAIPHLAKGEWGAAAKAVSPWHQGQALGKLVFGEPTWTAPDGKVYAKRNGELVVIKFNPNPEGYRLTGKTADGKYGIYQARDGSVTYVDDNGAKTNIPIPKGSKYLGDGRYQMPDGTVTKYDYDTVALKKGGSGPMGAVTKTPTPTISVERKPTVQLAGPPGFNSKNWQFVGYSNGAANYKNTVTGETVWQTPDGKVNRFQGAQVVTFNPATGRTTTTHFETATSPAGTGWNKSMTSTNTYTKNTSRGTETATRVNGDWVYRVNGRVVNAPAGAVATAAPQYVQQQMASDGPPRIRPNQYIKTKGDKVVGTDTITTKTGTKVNTQIIQRSNGDRVVVGANDTIYRTTQGPKPVPTGSKIVGKVTGQGGKLYPVYQAPDGSRYRTDQAGKSVYGTVPKTQKLLSVVYTQAPSTAKPVPRGAVATGETMTGKDGNKYPVYKDPKTGATYRTNAAGTKIFQTITPPKTGAPGPPTRRTTPVTTAAPTRPRTGDTVTITTAQKVTTRVAGGVARAEGTRTTSIGQPPARANGTWRRVGDHWERWSDKPFNGKYQKFETYYPPKVTGGGTAASTSSTSTTVTKKAPEKVTYKNGKWYGSDGKPLTASESAAADSTFKRTHPATTTRTRVTQQPVTQTTTRRTQTPVVATQTSSGGGGSSYTPQAPKQPTITKKQGGPAPKGISGAVDYTTTNQDTGAKVIHMEDGRVYSQNTAGKVYLAQKGSAPTVAAAQIITTQGGPPPAGIRGEVDRTTTNKDTGVKNIYMEDGRVYTINAAGKIYRSDDRTSGGTYLETYGTADRARTGGAATPPPTQPTYVRVTNIAQTDREHASAAGINPDNIVGKRTLKNGDVVYILKTGREIQVNTKTHDTAIVGNDPALASKLGGTSSSTSSTTSSATSTPTKEWTKAEEKTTTGVAAVDEHGTVLASRPGKNGNTILQMSDGRYVSVSPDGTSRDAGWWGDGQGGGTSVFGVGNSTTPVVEGSNHEESSEIIEGEFVPMHDSTGALKKPVFVGSSKGKGRSETEDNSDEGASEPSSSTSSTTSTVTSSTGKTWEKQSAPAKTDIEDVNEHGSVLASRAGKNGNTILQMSDGRYVAVSPDGTTKDAGWWGDGQGGGQSLAGVGNSVTDPSVTPNSPATTPNDPYAEPPLQPLSGGHQSW